MEDLSRICVVCCSSFPQNSGKNNFCDITDENEILKGHKSWKDNTYFSEFLRELEIVRDYHERNKQQMLNRTSVLAALDSYRDKVTVCETCLRHISGVMEIKPEVIEVEEKVSRLQREMMTELKRLQYLGSEFQRKMEAIQYSVRNSKADSLEAVLEVRNSSNRKRRITRLKEVDAGLGEDLLAFRMKIIEAVTDLGKFMTELDRKTEVDGKQINFLQWCVVPMDSPVEVEIKEEVEEPLCNSYNSPQREEIDHRLLPTEIIESSSNNILDDTGFPEDFEPAQEKDSDSESDYILPAKKKTSAASSKARKKNQRQASFKALRSDKTYSGVNFDEMSGFKQEIVRAVIRRQRYQTAKLSSSKEKETKDPIPEEFTAEYRCPLQYHSSNDRITAADSEIKFLGDSLQCGLCNFVISDGPKRSRVLESMYSHVAGQHFNAFQCGLCPKQYLCRKKYREHLYGVHVNPSSCNICGKPLFSSEGLGVHMWLHLNDEEKAQALKEGKAPRYHRDKEKKLGKPLEIFKCGICGKDFHNRPNLLKHEQRHNSEDTVICPKCGKEMKRISYKMYHQKYACPMESQSVNARRFVCIHCNGMYQSKQSLRKHIERTHSSAAAERPHICDICGKGYKTGSDMRYHARTHSSEKQWKCDKCGKGFVMKRNLARHACPYGDNSKGRRRRGMDTGRLEASNCDVDGYNSFSA